MSCSGETKWITFNLSARLRARFSNPVAAHGHPPFSMFAYAASRTNPLRSTRRLSPPPPSTRPPNTIRVTNLCVSCVDEFTGRVISALPRLFIERYGKKKKKNNEISCRSVIHRGSDGSLRIIVYYWNAAVAKLCLLFLWNGHVWSFCALFSFFFFSGKILGTKNLRIIV